ncbi:hypothetical protein IV203_029585 [Nitzschia inconspicua]|uniref:Uncharacterized protein n=1 Tax=Nitzschia inconspicua TaxID=303405 RepID=A0A9K3LRX8_9STRA|nr:hypothetical protein IV203_029585 [Nitzschia inconspicua]
MRIFNEDTSSCREEQPQHQVARKLFDSFSSLDHNDDNVMTPGMAATPSVKGFMREIQAVLLWSSVSLLFRLFIGISIGLASHGQESISDSTTTETTVTNIASSPVFFVANFLLYCLPAKVLTNQCPGFYFSSAAILLWIRDKIGVFPNLPIRCCEYMLGRLGLRELVLVSVIHFSTFYSVGFFVRQSFSPESSSLMLESVDYDDAGNLWIVMLFRQVFITSVFVVSLLVVPILLQLNKIPRWTLVFLLYPLYQYSVGKSGGGEFFSPNALVSLDALGGRPVSPSWRVCGPIIGGLVGGLVMNRYFPDESTGKHIKD